MTGRHCMDCVFVRGTDAGRLECHHSAPVVLSTIPAMRISGVHIPATTVTGHPEVDALDSCGEWKSALAAMIEDLRALR